jgi:hypothetical protein
MIGAFAAFGVDAGLAVVAVLVYRAFTFWLPLIPASSPTSSCANVEWSAGRTRPRRRAALHYTNEVKELERECPTSRT